MLAGIRTALAILAIAAFSPSARASVITTSFITDAGQSASASALFVLSSGTLTLTLTDTTANPISDASNLAEISFAISGLTGLGGSTVGMAGGSTITGITAGGTGTVGTFNGPSPWNLSYGSAGWQGGAAFDLFAPGPGGPDKVCSKGNDAAPFSIIGGSNGSYTPPGKTKIGSANAFDTGCDGTMFYGSATFTLLIPGLTSTSTISNVVFGFGPDSANSPDGDDFSPGTGGSTATPEPSTLALMGSGLLALGFVRRKKFGRV